MANRDWLHSLEAAFKQVWGTDEHMTQSSKPPIRPRPRTSIFPRPQEFGTAAQAIQRMSDAAENLREDTGIQSVPEALARIIKDLS